MTDTAVSGGGVGGVAVGLGFVAGGPVELAGVVGGPFITAVVSDVSGGVAAVIAVVDSDSADETLGVLADAAAVEVGGVVSGGEPVGSAVGLAGLFEMPSTVEVFTGPSGETHVVYLTSTDRRDTTDDGFGEGVSGPPVGVAGIGHGRSNSASGGGGLDKLINVALEVSVELGRTRVTLSEVLDYDVGSIIELDRAAGAPVDVRVNDTLLAQGEVVLIDDEYAVRITAIIEPHQT